MSQVLSTVLPCTDCTEHRQDLEGTGHHVVDCREDPTMPGYCVLRYTQPAATRDGPPAVAGLTATQARATSPESVTL